MKGVFELAVLRSMLLRYLRKKTNIPRVAKGLGVRYLTRAQYIPLPGGKTTGMVDERAMYSRTSKV